MNRLGALKSFIERNRKQTIDRICTSLFPKIAGRYCFYFLDCESWESITCRGIDSDPKFDCLWINGETSIRGKRYKEITTYSRHYTEVHRHYYEEANPRLDQKVSDLLEYYQFCNHTGFGDWNLPCTWDDIFESTVKEYSPWGAASEFLNSACPISVRNFLLSAQTEVGIGDAGCLWHFLYGDEIDDGEFYYVVEDAIATLLEKLRVYTLGSLQAEFELEYRRVLRRKGEVRSAQEADQDRLKKLRILGHGLLPKFRKQLLGMGVIPPENLRFAKDQALWPHIKTALETFSPKERAAIVHVSSASNSVLSQYSRLRE